MNKLRERCKIGFWWALAAAQIVFLCLVALRAGGAVIDDDAGKVYTHMMAIWESGTLAVPDWRYITTMELDCTTLLALPFYGLTGNPTLAFWCGNVILLGLWAALLALLVRRLGGSWARGGLAVLAVLLPYEFCAVGYWNMLFLNASQYAFKVMLPLLLVALLLAPDRPRRRDWVLLAVYLGGVFLTGLSSGVYVAACGLAPVLVLAVWEWLHGRISATPYRLVCAGGSVVLTLAGMTLQSRLGIVTNATSMTFNTLDTLRDNAVNCVIAFFRLFGLVPGAPVTVFSPQGISLLVRLAAVGGALAVCLWFTVRALGGKLPPALRPGRYLAAIFWWNLGVLLLTNTRYGDPYFEYRYHLMGAVPVLVLAALAAPALAVRPVRLHRAAVAGGTVLMVALALVVNRDGVKAIWQEDGTFGVNGPEREICGIVNALDVEDVIITAGSGTTEICGALDPTRRYITLNSTEEGNMALLTWDGYYTDTDGLSYDKPAAVVCTIEEGVESLPAYLANQCVEVGRTSQYIVLRTTGAPLVDGMTGLPNGDEGVDYPDSTWYTYTGTMDDTRRLHTDSAGGDVLYTPALELHTDVRITLTCDTEGSGTVGKVQRWQRDGTLADEVAVPAGNAPVSLDLPAGQGDYLVLVMDPGVSATVGPLYFEALS